MSDLLNTIAPEFDADPLRGDFLELAAGRLTGAAWGSQYGLAVAYLAAHMLKEMRLAESEAGIDGGGGPVSSKTAGDLSISYATISTMASNLADAWLAETRYGRAFLSIRNSRSAGRMGLLVPG